MHHSFSEELKVRRAASDVCTGILRSTGNAVETMDEEADLGWPLWGSSQSCHQTSWTLLAAVLRAATTALSAASCPAAPWKALHLQAQACSPLRAQRGHPSEHSPASQFSLRTAQPRPWRCPELQCPSG